MLYIYIYIERDDIITGTIWRTSTQKILESPIYLDYGL